MICATHEDARSACDRRDKSDHTEATLGEVAGIGSVLSRREKPPRGQSRGHDDPEIFRMIETKFRKGGESGTPTAQTR
jgi:hypothetical protein